MFVHVVSRPLPPAARVSAAIRVIADSVRDAGAEVTVDVSPAGGDIHHAVRELGAQLDGAWSISRPDVVHTVGLVATMAALDARRDGMRIVATFHERGIPTQLERSAAARVDAVVPLSSTEMDAWRGRGVRTFHPGVLIPVLPSAPASSADANGPVVCQATGPSLPLIIESMAFWGPNRLILLGRLDAGTRGQVRQLAQQLGVLDRIDYRHGLAGERRSAVWSKASVLIAGTDGARHGGDVLEAAAHGVATVAVAACAHRDHIIEGATGVLVEPQGGARALGQAVQAILRDPLRCAGMGAAALLRIQSLPGPAVTGQRLVDMYGQICGITSAQAQPAAAGLSESAAELAVAYMPLARQLAHRYAGRGQRLEDLIQVASLGLVRAASRFDPDYGAEFHSFAVPTILGELRRHFRDHAWAARVPRSLQEVTLRVLKATDQLRATRGEDPSPQEIADHLGLLEEEVRFALQVRGEAMNSKSLDHPMGDDGTEAYGDLVGDLDPDLEYVELRQAVRDALQRLPERERSILVMRFYGEQTQAEIADQLGLSQVHVSRLITKTLALLRDHVNQDVPLPQSWTVPLEPPLALPARRAA